MFHVAYASLEFIRTDIITTFIPIAKGLMYNEHTERTSTEN